LRNPHCAKLPTLAQYWTITAKYLAIRYGLLRTRTSEGIGRYSAHFRTYGVFRSIWREIYTKTPYYFRTNKVDPVILDVGSNVGVSVLYFLQLYPNARITAFEPDLGTFQLLSETVESNNLNVELVNKAVYSYTGSLTWHGGEPGSLSSSILSRDADHATPNTATRPCVRLSDYVAGPVDLLKLDVEGVEIDVLTELAESGAIRQIQRMAIEFHPWAGRAVTELTGLLTRCGFTVTESADFKHMVFAERDSASPYETNPRPGLPPCAKRTQPTQFALPRKTR